VTTDPVSRLVCERVAELARRLAALDEQVECGELSSVWVERRLAHDELDFLTALTVRRLELVQARLDDLAARLA
jgi:hypothetical protein